MKPLISFSLIAFVLMFYSCKKDFSENPIEITLASILEMKLENSEQISLTNMSIGQISLFELPVDEYGVDSTTTYTLVLEVVDETEDGFLIHEYMAYKNSNPIDEKIDPFLPTRFETNEVAKYILKVSDSNFELEKIESYSKIFENNQTPNHLIIDSLDFSLDYCYPYAVKINGEIPTYLNNEHVSFDGAGSINDQVINGKTYSNCFINFHKLQHYGKGRTNYMITNSDGLILRVYHEWTNLEGYIHCLSLVPAE